MALHIISETPQEEIAATQSALAGQAGRPALVPGPQQDRFSRDQPRTASGRLLPITIQGNVRRLHTERRSKAWRDAASAMDRALARMKAGQQPGQTTDLDSVLDDYEDAALKALHVSTRNIGDLRDRLRLVAHFAGCRDTIGTALATDWHIRTPLEKLFGVLDHEMYCAGREIDIRLNPAAEKAREAAFYNRQQVRCAANDNKVRP